VYKNVQNLKFVSLPVPGIIGGTQKIWAVNGYAHAPFSPKYLMRLCSNGHCECPGQIWSSYSFTRSWDNSDWSSGWGLRTPNLGGKEAVGGRVGDGIVRKSVGDFLYKPSVVTFPLSLRVSEILPLLCSSTLVLFPTPPLVSPKFSHVSLGLGGWHLGYEERRCWANCPRT